MKIFLLSFLLLTTAGTAQARLIEFLDFSWGSALLEVERKAADHGFLLREKEISGIEPRLEYRATLHGRQCRLFFFFAPHTGRLFQVSALWDHPDFGEIILAELIRIYGQPREEIPGAGISIWTRRMTELTLRLWREETRLNYRHIHLHQESREATRLIKSTAEEQ